MNNCVTQISFKYYNRLSVDVHKTYYLLTEIRILVENLEDRLISAESALENVNSHITSLRQEGNFFVALIFNKLHPFKKGKTLIKFIHLFFYSVFNSIHHFNETIASIINSIEELNKTHASTSQPTTGTLLP